MGDTYFISDLHIGGGADRAEQQKLTYLFSFLESINSANNELYIIGDLFDFWFEYKYVIPKKFFEIFYQFRKLIENKISVNFIPGNHDYWIMDFFQEQVGFTVHPDEYAVQIQSKRIYLFHGDGISKKDKGYRILKKIFRNPVNIFLYRWLHPDLGIPLARLTSHTSRKHTANKLLHDEADYLEFAVDKFNSGFDCVIVGHSHRPCLENINGKYFINLGDWINHFSYGVLSKGNFSLNYWKP